MTFSSLFELHCKCTHHNEISEIFSDAHQPDTLLFAFKKIPLWPELFSLANIFYENISSLLQCNHDVDDDLLQ